MIYDKAKAKIGMVKRDREGNYILIRGSIDNEKISVLNMYARNGIPFTFIRRNW